MKTESTFVRHCPCEHCGSSDAGALYSDGHIWCHACSKYTPGGSEEDYEDRERFKEEWNRQKAMEETQEHIEYKAIPERGITKQTCEKFGVVASEETHIYPYFDANGKKVGEKRRYVKDKSFAATGKIKEAGLFGQHLFSRGGKFITLVEGELDALAAYQMNGSMYPVVSIKSGASGALKDCQKEFEWLDSFDAVVVCFDADEPGRKAASDVAELFGTKAKVVRLSPELKDACGYLQAGQTKQYISAWWAAEEYRPDGIINGKDLYELIKKPQQKPDAHWPWKTLDGVTDGLRKRELITIAAGTGQGKSTFLRQLIHHLLKTTDDKIGMAFLEESPQRTALGIMSIEARKALHRPDTVYTEEELDQAFKSTMGTERCSLFNHYGSLQIDNVLNRLRWMVKAMGCSWLVLDHYQMILSGMDTDERKGLDMLLTKLRTFVEETGVGLFGVSHTRRQDGKGLENGGEISLSSLRGTQGIAQLSDLVIGLKRDQQATEERVRNTTEVASLKNRFNGITGPAGYLYFNPLTNCLEEVDGPELVEAL